MLVVWVENILCFIMEKVYITPTYGDRLHNPQPMKQSISPPELFKTGQITPKSSFEKS